MSETSDSRETTTFDSAIDPDREPDEDRTGGDEEADTPENTAEDKPESDGHGLSAKA
jgi:hypothetical protein